MKNRSLLALLGTGIVAAGLGAPAALMAAEQCEPVRGKISNTFIAQDGSGTLGVVTLGYGKKKKGSHWHENDEDAMKLKCALVGRSQSADPSSIAFIHIISCEDSIRTPVGPLHSTIWLYTVGQFGPPENPSQVATFEETSTLLPEPSGPPPTGIFQGATSSSSISVTGAVYKTGAIEMKFKGQICKPGN